SKSSSSHSTRRHHGSAAPRPSKPSDSPPSSTALSTWRGRPDAILCTAALLARRRNAEISIGPGHLLAVQVWIAQRRRDQASRLALPDSPTPLLPYSPTPLLSRTRTGRVWVGVIDHDRLIDARSRDQGYICAPGQLSQQEARAYPAVRLAVGQRSHSA